MNTEHHPIQATQTATPATRADEMLSKKELAARLKVTVRTIENWQARGLLSYIKISSVVLFYWPEVSEHLRNHFRVCRRGNVRPNGNSKITTNKS